MTAITVPTSQNAHRVFNPGYIGYDLRRNVRMVPHLFFMIVLPVVLFLIFGSMQPYADVELANGRGNVAAQVMMSMAVYGAITATVGMAGAAAVELQQGWGRQIGLTPFSRAGYVVSKVVVALALATLPIIAVFAVAASTGARVDAWLWPVLALLILAGCTVFALYGLAFGLFFRSESAVSAASGLVVVLMFAGNAFTPLSGTLLDLSVWTPVWGVMQLATWPLAQGTVVLDTITGATTHYELWQVLLNVAAWAAIFAALCIAGARRHTARR